MNSLDLDRSRDVRRASEDLTVGIEEEFSILDPRDARSGAALRGAARRRRARDPLLHEAHHRRADLLGDRDHLRAPARPARRARAASASAAGALFALAGARRAPRSGATGTHPWADYREQPIIDTEHYHRVEEGLKYVAWRNNTFSLHVHVGIRDIDRAVRVCDRLRPVLPLLLAVSANSPFLDGRDAGLHSARTQTFTRSFPRCGVPDAFGGWPAYRDYIEFLIAPARSSSSRRSGGRCGRTSASARSRCASATRRRPPASPRRSRALIVACVAQAARDVDEGVPFADPAPRLIEENMWRAIRYGLDGQHDRPRRAAQEYPAREIVERLRAWTAPVRAELGDRPRRSPSATARSASAR